jgi:hypothetical protein
MERPRTWCLLHLRLYHGYTMAIPWLYHGYTMERPRTWCLLHLQHAAPPHPRPPHPATAAPAPWLPRAALPLCMPHDELSRSIVPARQEDRPLMRATMMGNDGAHKRKKQQRGQNTQPESKQTNEPTNGARAPADPERCAAVVVAVALSLKARSTAARSLADVGTPSNTQWMATSPAPVSVLACSQLMASCCARDSSCCRACCHRSRIARRYPPTAPTSTRASSAASGTTATTARNDSSHAHAKHSGWLATGGRR